MHATADALGFVIGAAQVLAAEESARVPSPRHLRLSLNFNDFHTLVTGMATDRQLQL